MKQYIVKCLLAALALLTSLPAAAGAVRLELSVKADDNGPIPVELYGMESRPKVLVVVLPGTGGLSDPYFDAEVMRSTYDPEHRGGLTTSLLAAGYAVAYVSQRGYRVGARCVPALPLAERLDRLADACIDGARRAKVSLSTVTQDTLAVLTWLRNTYGLSIIVMAYSEGGYHIAKLIHDRAFVPAGLVLIGTPLQSLSEVFQYQISRQFASDLARRALETCPSKSLSVSEAFACAGIEALPERREQLLAFLGQDRITPEAVAARLAAHRASLNEMLLRFAGPERPAIMSATWLGRQVPSAWSGKFYAEIFASTTPVAALLADYDGPVALFFGELDDMVQHENAMLCRHGRAPCVQARIIPRADHALGAADHLPTPATMGQLHATLDSMLEH